MRISDNDIAKAEQMDLLTYLQIYEPGNRKRVAGNEYRTIDHDSLRTTRLTILDDASDRLFRASAMMAMEPNSVPAASLPRQSRRLQAMPTRLARLP